MKKIVLVDQTSGFLVVDDLNAYCAKYDSVSVLCSSLRPGMRPVNPKINIDKICNYDRSSSTKRMATWLLASMQVFFKITLPLLRPILVYVLITSLIGGLQLFDVPQILTNGTGDPMRSSMTLIMFLNKHLYSKNYGMAGALSVVLFFITGVLSLVVFKITGNDKRKG